MAAPASRNIFIDHLRVAVTALVVLHHAAIVYGGSGGWYWRQEPDASNRLLILFNALNQSWFMGCFFLLAGYFTPRSFDRKGAGAFLADRFLRLGLPLVGYFLILSPLTIALARTASGHEFWSGWWLMTREREFEPGPLWFAEALLIFAVAYAAWRKLRPVSGAGFADLPSHRTLLLAALAVGATNFLVRLAMPVGENIAGLQLGYFPAYVLFFAAGCLAARTQLLERIEFAQARPWLMASGLLVGALLLVMITRGHLGGFSGGWSFNAAFYAFWDPLIAWGIILTLLWLFRTRLAEGNRFTAALARRAFGAYIVHPPVLVGLSLLARGWPVPPLLKFAIVGSVACAGAFAVASLLLLVPGVRKIV